jgi:hypothetical protein
MIRILDDALPYPMAYLAEVRRLAFRDVKLGPDTFRGIATSHRADVDKAAEAETGGVSTLSFFRRSPAGQIEPNFVHSDEAMGQFTGIYYMNPEPAEGDGTAFWERDGDGWKLVRLVPAKFNRLLTFTAELHHSRALFDNYGEGNGARLIQVIFLRDRPAPIIRKPGAVMPTFVRLPDWQSRLADCLNARAAEPYRYGTNDCACLARAAVEAVTGVDVAPGMEMPKGWISAAKVMIAHGWNSVEDMATELLGEPVDPSESRPGDIVSFEECGELHLAARVGDVAITPSQRGTDIVDRAAWLRAWKIG